VETDTTLAYDVFLAVVLPSPPSWLLAENPHEL
jgi:hypothetical protein